MSTPTLLVIDVQRAFDDPSWAPRNNHGAEQRIAEALAGWRERGAPVIHVRHASARPGGLFVPGTPAFEFKPEAQPLDGEPVITKVSTARSLAPTSRRGCASTASRRWRSSG